MRFRLLPLTGGDVLVLPLSANMTKADACPTRAEGRRSPLRGSIAAIRCARAAYCQQLLKPTPGADCRHSLQERAELPATTEADVHRRCERDPPAQGLAGQELLCNLSLELDAVRSVLRLASILRKPSTGSIQSARIVRPTGPTPDRRALLMILHW